MSRLNSPTARWPIAVAAVAIHLCLGTVYAWSVFRGPLAQVHGWTPEQTVAPFRWLLGGYALGMLLGGLLQDRLGPRPVTLGGGVLLAAGCLAAWWTGASMIGLCLGYGLVGGIGIGAAYLAPVATLIKWFPEKKGLITGIAILGFGSGSLVFAPLIETFLLRAPSIERALPETFLWMAVGLGSSVAMCALLMRNPPGTKAMVLGEGISPQEAVRDGGFYRLWFLFGLGLTPGLVILGEAAVLLGRFEPSTEWLTPGLGVGLGALANGLGRLVLGLLSDRIGIAFTQMAAMGLTVAGCLGLVWAESFETALGALCSITFAFGGFIATMPPRTAAAFGVRYLGGNYGVLFTAYGIAGFLTPILAPSLADTKLLALVLAVFALFAGFGAHAAPGGRKNRGS